MITALVSSVMGIFSGLLPDLLKIWKTKVDNEHELAVMDKQIEAQKALGAMKLDEIRENRITEEIKATSQTITAAIEASSVQTHISWIDGFNALIRPLTAAMVMTIFCWTSYIFIDAVVIMLSAKQIGALTAAEVIWSSLIGETIQAVLGFLFGWRGYARANAKG